MYKTISFFPFSAFTLRFLVPRCCRVTLQPGLGGRSCISFLGLQGHSPLFLNLIGANTECNGVKRKAGLKTSKNHNSFIS